MKKSTFYISLDSPAQASGRAYTECCPYPFAFSGFDDLFFKMDVICNAQTSGKRTDLSDETPEYRAVCAATEIKLRGECGLGRKESGFWLAADDMGRGDSQITIQLLAQQRKTWQGRLFYGSEDETGWPFESALQLLLQLCSLTRRA